MKRRRSPVLLGTTIAAAVAAVGFAAGPAQANTTLPGVNGKIAFTTDAWTIPASDELGATGKGSSEECISPVPLLTEILQNPSGDALYCGAEINTINPDGSGQAAVTNDFYPDDAPAWSPQDGSRIAYQTSQGENCTDPQTILNFDCNYDIWTSAADGSDAHQVTSGPVNELHPSYSPDGSMIAFDGANPSIVPPSSGASTKLQYGVDPIAQQFDHLAQAIYTVPATGGTPTVLEPASEIGPGEDLVSDSQAAWSPDGSQIAFTRLTMGPVQGVGAASSKQLGFVAMSMGTYVAPAGGGASHEIGSSAPCVVPIEIVPTVVAASRNADVQAAARNASTAATREISQDCSFDAAPAWSPDGSKLAVERVQIGPDFEDTDIVVMNSVDGSGEVNLSNVTEPADCTPATCGFDQKPAWSPDGAKIAFFSDRGADGLYPANCEDTNACDDEIWTMNADGSSPVQVTNNDVNDINPDWQRIPPQPAPVVQPVTTPPPAPPAKPAVAPKVGVAGVRRACVSRSFHLRFRIATTASSVKRVVVKLDGRRIKSTKRAKFTLTIKSRKLKAGHHRLTITATATNGKVKTIHRKFSVCKAAKPRHRSAPRFTG